MRVSGKKFRQPDDLIRQLHLARIERFGNVLLACHDKYRPPEAHFEPQAERATFFSQPTKRINGKGTPFLPLSIRRRILRVQDAMNTPPPLSPPSISSNDRLWIILSHISVVFGAGLVLPLIVYLWKKPESTVVADHAKEALNFHLSLFIYSLACIPLVFIFIGIPLLILLGLFSLIMSIIGTIKASDGNLYRYPLTIRFI
jgi:uncharacterized protein